MNTYTKYLVLILFQPIGFFIYGQDAYHTWLLDHFNTKFNLPKVQNWVLPNTEQATIALAINYGGENSSASINNKEFSLVVSRKVNGGANYWDAGHLYSNQSSIAVGDQCLMVIWLKSNNTSSKLNFFAEKAITYDKEVISEITVTSEWQLYLLPFKSQRAYSKDGLNFGLHLASSTHTIDIGGMAVVNYKTLVPYNQLPIQLNVPLYDGADSNAPWRAQAENDISKYRIAKLNIKLNGQGNHNIKIEQLQHDFKFGTAVVSNKFNQSESNSIYEQKLLNLDGKGHGFNEVVFENDLKWPGWEGHWLSSQDDIRSDINWLNQHGISVRGHNLMWPGWPYSPSDINATKSPAYILNRQVNHIKSILSNTTGVGNGCQDWDVINEITTNNDYANHFKGSPGYLTGRELYSNIFKLVDSLAPDATLYLNDFVALELADNPNNNIQKWKTYISELINSGAPLEAIGFQGHFSAAPTGIPRVKQLLDDFWNTYQLPAKITEYDISNLISGELQAKYMNDILTIIYAHPSMRGFIMWGFWDGAHWLGNAPIYDANWQLKPSGKAFIDKVYKQWWTDVSLLHSGSNFTYNVHKGKYKITVEREGSILYNDVIDILDDKVIDLSIVSTHNTPKQKVLVISPNPIVRGGHIHLDTDQLPQSVVVLDLYGREVQKEENIYSTSIDLPTYGLSNGSYIIKMKYHDSSEISRLIFIQ